MKNDNRMRQFKRALLALASAALLTPVVHGATVTPNFGDVILGFRATGNPGQTINLEVDLGPVSQFYGLAPGATLPLSALSVVDLRTTYGTNWYTRPDLYWGAIATAGRASAYTNGVVNVPIGTLWATTPNGAVAWNRGSSFAQKNASATIEAIFSTPGVGSFNGATSTTNSSTAAIIDATRPGSWTYQDSWHAGTSFDYFNPTIDSAVTNIAVRGQVLAPIYELQPASTATNGTLLGNLVLTQNGLSFRAAGSASTATIGVTVDPSSGGTVSGGGTYTVGDSVQISAAANTGWAFTGWNDSNTNATRTIITPVTNFTYTAGFSQLSVATPTILPHSGTFTNAVSVTLASSTGGATIHYTTDGSTPTTNSAPYVSVITLSNSATVTAIAVATGYAPSSVATASFTIITLPTVATPVFLPAGGSYTTSVQVAISSSTSNATIRYTTDGSVPTVNSPVYTGLITLSQATTLKAVGFVVGDNPSPVATARFAFNLPSTLIILSGSSLPAALKGAAYSQTFAALNGTGAYTWSVAPTSKLPAGLKLSATGVLSGTLTKTDTSSFVVVVKDAAGNTAHQTFNLIVTDPAITYTPLVGTYTGLILQINTAPTHASSGFIQIVLSKTGSFAANLTLAGKKTAYKGQFDLNGQASNIVAGVTVLLAVDVTGDSGAITGTVTGGGITSELLAELPGTSPVGTYTLNLSPADESVATKPQGYGSATLTFNKTGLGSLTGVLNDGTKVTAKAPVSRNGNWPLYVSLNKDTGSAISWVGLSTSNATGVVDWFAPASGAYAAFSTTLTLTGSPYTTGPVLSGTWNVTLRGGGLASNIVQAVTLDAAGAVTGANALGLKVTVKTGQLSGSFTPPGGSKAIPFTGLLLQAQKTGAGLFTTAAGQSGGFVLNPIP